MQAIIVSWAKDEKFMKMTQQAVDSSNIECIVVEQNKGVKYSCKTIHYNFKFNYHRCMNLGLRHTTDKYVVICNNDLLFYPDWSDNLEDVLDLGYDTVCPYCPVSHRGRLDMGNHIYEGFRVGFEFVGWCIAARRELFEEIPLNERIEFWYSDNWFAEALKVSGKRHALVCNSLVEHLEHGSRTLNTVSRTEQVKLTRGQQLNWSKEKSNLYAKRKRIRKENS
jgi:GT2 family glycosyltransferase